MRAIAPSGEGDPIAALNVISAINFHQVGAKSGLQGHVWNVDRLPGFEHDLDRTAFHRPLIVASSIVVPYARDGFQRDTPPGGIVTHDHQVIESDQRVESLVQRADQGIAIAAGDESFRDLKQRAVLESTIVGHQFLMIGACLLTHGGPAPAVHSAGHDVPFMLTGLRQIISRLHPDPDVTGRAKALARRMAKCGGTRPPGR